MTQAHDTSKSTRLRPNSIFVKLALAFGLAAAALTGFTAVDYSRATFRIVEKEIRGASRDVNEIATGNLSGAIRFGDAGPIEQQIAGLTASDEAQTVYGLAINAAGEVITGAGARPDVEADLVALARRSLDADETVTSADGMFVATPARFGDKTVGVFATANTAEFALAEARADHNKVTLIAIAIVLVGIVGLMLLVRVLVARPITRLTGTVDEIAKGNLDIDVPGIRRGDELGAIAKSMEHLRGALKDASAARVENQFRGAAFRASASAMMMIDRQRKVIHANRAVMDLVDRHREAFGAHGLDADPEALIGTDIARYFPTSAQAGLMAALDEADGVARSVNVALGDVRLLVKISAVADDQGAEIGFVVEWQDVSETHLNAAVLDAIDSSQVRADFDIDGRLISGNRQMLDSWGLSPADIARMPGLRDLPELADAFARLCKGEAVFGIFPGPNGADGNPVLTDGVFTPVKDEKGQLTRIVLIGKDVTETQRGLVQAEAERAAMLAAQAVVVEQLRNGLGKLRDGDLTTQIEAEFAEDYEQLRLDFNQAADHLLQAMHGVIENAGLIRGEATQISSAADDLSQRTERQAATLEETASALDELTASVKSAAEGATHASNLVEGARKDAEDSGDVVREAVAAMGEIEKSSSQISKITDVIDDIAFQTNLLALNAGVEAARAGEAGRGFAVVASEVRALAQRSSDAAREINDLISASGNQVSRGVELVDRAGVALNQIVERVKEISQHVSEIAVSSREQSSGLVEINTAMEQLDHVTQQNAAMFEETSAATHALTREAEALNKTTGRFRTQPAEEHKAKVVAVSFGGLDSARERGREDPTVAAKTVVAGGTAAPTTSGGDGWDEF